MFTIGNNKIIVKSDFVITSCSLFTMPKQIFGVLVDLAANINSSRKVTLITEPMNLVAREW